MACSQPASVLQTARSSTRRVGKFNRFKRLLKRGRGTGRGSVEDSHHGRDEVVFFFARRARGAAARREDVPQLLDRELAEGVARGPRRRGRRLDGRLRVDRGRFDVVGTESPLLLSRGLGLRQPFLEFLNSGRLRRLGPSVGGLAARVFFDVPLLDLRGSRGPCRACSRRRCSWRRRCWTCAAW